MDSKTIKNNLKEAKEAIKSKDIMLALKLCKEILKDDPNNYMAMVILGAAFQESDKKSEAPVSYKKAIEISPDQILAWQGLASYYEKEKCFEELFSVYEKILNLGKDDKKWKDVVEKFEKVVKKTNKLEEGILVLYPFVEEEEKAITVLDTLAKFFLHMKEVSEKLHPCYEKVLKHVINDNGHPEQKDFFRRYIKLLYGKKEYTELFVNCEHMYDLYPSDVYPLEWACRVYYELRTLNSTMQDGIEETIDSFSSRLLSLNSDSIFGLMVHGIQSYEDKNYVVARDAFTRVTEIRPQMWQAWYWLANTHEALCCYSEVLFAVSKTRDTIPSNAVNNNAVAELLHHMYLKALAESGEKGFIELCIEECLKVLSDDPANKLAIVCLIKCHLFEEDIEQAEMYLSELSASVYERDIDLLLLRSVCNKSRGLISEASSILIQAVEQNIDDPDIWTSLGELYQLEGNYIESFQSFLKAAKCSPCYYIPFLRLGSCYRDVAKNLEQARRCLEKAFELNPYSETVGMALSDVYQELHKMENNFELLETATKLSGKKWCWLRLGLQHLDVGNIPEAVDCLRCAVRLDSADYHSWECLADACLAKGSYLAAMKCYEKCISLNPQALYPALQVATIKQLIGMYDEGITEFRQIVSTNPDYIPALKGLAEICLLKAKELLQRQTVIRARELCQEAIDCLVKAFKQDNRLMCLWKIFIDVCVVVCSLPSHLASLKIPRTIVDDIGNGITDNDEMELHKNQLIDLALRCALSLLSGNKFKEVSHFLWHDVAYCYNMKADNAEDQSLKVELRLKSLAAAKNCVSLDPKVWDHWNLLGVITLTEEINNLKLTQHSFIRAIQLDRRNAIPWCNLGVLYIYSNDVHLANEVFSIAQGVDPENPVCWTGQALIAESVDHVETLDLFYHAVHLGYHPESAFGFSEWIVKMLKDWHTYKSNPLYHYVIEKLRAVYQAVVALTWYTTYNPNDACALNMLGILLEWCNLHKSALGATEKALSLTLESDKRDMVVSNVGRQMYKCGRYKEAIEAYRQIKCTDLKTQCGLAIALFKAGCYEEAFAVYESAAGWFDQPVEYAGQISMAMASMVYISNRNPDLFMHCLKMKPPPIHGVFAACAMFLLSKKWNLLELALKELDNFKEEKEHAYNVALLNSYALFFQGKFKESVSYVSKFIYSYPGDPSLWMLLCLLLLLHIYTGNNPYANTSSSAASHAQRAISLGESVLDLSKVYALRSLCYLLSNKMEESLRISSKAVRLFPNVAENWSVLIAAMCANRFKTEIIKNTISHVKRHVVCSQELTVWLSDVDECLSNS